jgi:hypothetical protein
MQIDRVYKSNNVYCQWSDAEMQEAKNSVLQGNLPAFCYCFVSCTILTLQRRVAVTRMRIDLQGDARTRPIGHPPSYAKDNYQIPNEKYRR